MGFFSSVRQGQLMTTNPIYQLESAIVKGKINKIACRTEKCLKAGYQPKTIIDRAVTKAMKEVGKKWKTYEYFIPNVLVSAMAIKLCLKTLDPLLKKSQRQALGKAVAGTVEGDIHDIGKNILIMFMEADGFEVIDLGVDIAPDQFVKVVRKEKADLLLVSCLYSVTMPSMEDTIIALKKAGLKGKVKTIVGGAPITQAFAESIGADGFGRDALEGVQKAKELVNGSQ
jgi:5-methyltetrahydrofolate--homocysteine methyltransferase